MAACGCGLRLCLIQASLALAINDQGSSAPAVNSKFPSLCPWKRLRTSHFITRPLKVTLLFLVVAGTCQHVRHNGKTRFDIHSPTQLVFAIQIILVSDHRAFLATSPPVLIATLR